MDEMDRMDGVDGALAEAAQENIIAAGNSVFALVAGASRDRLLRYPTRKKASAWNSVTSDTLSPLRKSCISPALLENLELPNRPSVARSPSWNVKWAPDCLIVIPERYN